MALYELDERSITGHSETNAAHRHIAELAERVVRVTREGADFATVEDAFSAFAEALISHFATEEHILDGLPKTERVREHVSRHLKDHDTFRDMLSYVADKFDEKRDTGEIPNVVNLIPQQYFEELQDLDAEMSDLLREHGLTDENGPTAPGT